MDTQNSKTLGSLTEQEMAQFSSAKSRAEQLVQQLGLLELRKSRVVSQIEENERAGQLILNSVRERLAISSDTTWQILPDGTITTPYTENSEGEG